MNKPVATDAGKFGDLSRSQPEINDSNNAPAGGKTMRDFWQWMFSPSRRGPMLVAPALIMLFVMNIFPLMWSFGLSFFHYKASSIRPPRFAGLY